MKIKSSDMYELTTWRDSKKLKEIIREYNQTIYEYNETIHQQEKNIEELKNKQMSTQKENQKLKKSLENLEKMMGVNVTYTNIDEQNEKPLPKKEDLPNIDYVKFSKKYSDENLLEKKLEKYFEKYFDYQGFYQQIELQNAREKELRNIVEEKIKRVDQVERKIEKVYDEINQSVKQRVETLEKKFMDSEKNNFDISKRVYNLEKEKEKEQMSRDLIKKGISQSINEDLLEPDCVNRNSCRVCLEDPKCVWCSIEQKCKSGDLSGPFDGTCLNTFQYSTCASNTCTSLTCSECIRDPSCGWCNSEKRCMEGTAKGSIGYICSGKFIHLDNDQRCDILFL